MKQTCMIARLYTGADAGFAKGGVYFFAIMFRPRGDNHREVRDCQKQKKTNKNTKKNKYGIYFLISTLFEQGTQTHTHILM